MINVFGVNYDHYNFSVYLALSNVCHVSGPRIFFESNKFKFIGVNLKRARLSVPTNFGGNLDNVLRTKFGAYMMSRIFDFFSKKILRVIYEKIRDFFVDYTQIFFRKKNQKSGSSYKRQI